MSFVKCWDAAEMVVDEATRQFGCLLKPDEVRKENLKRCCGMIDSLAEEFDGYSYEINIDDETMWITISLVCGEFKTTAHSSCLCRLLQRTDTVSFSKAADEQIRVDFGFRGIWVKASRQG